MRAAITGGGGFVGSALGKELLRQGHDVSVLTRQRDGNFPAGVRVVTGDLTTDDGSARVLVESCEVLFHCAGEVRDVARMRAVHVEGTKRLLAAVRAAAAGRDRVLHWVQLSSVGAYGSVEGKAGLEREVTEESPEAPAGEYETTKTISDVLVRKAGQDGLLTYTIVRPSNVFGAAMPNNSLRQLAQLVRRGWFCYVGRPGAVATYVHVDDVVELLVRCACDPRARNQVFNISNDCGLEELIAGLAKAMAVSPPRLRLPEEILRAGAAAGAFCGLRLLTQSRIDALVARTGYPAGKASRLLSFVPLKPVPSAIGEVVDGHSPRRSTSDA